jgi:hypothetical protein
MPLLNRCGGASGEGSFVTTSVKVTASDIQAITIPYPSDSGLDANSDGRIKSICLFVQKSGSDIVDNEWGIGLIYNRDNNQTSVTYVHDGTTAKARTEDWSDESAINIGVNAVSVYITLPKIFEPNASDSGVVYCALVTYD